MARPGKPARRSPSTTAASGTVVKLQILLGVFVPLLLLGLWLHRQGFW